MTSYILKKTSKEQEILLYQEKISYTFRPRKSYKDIKEIKVFDLDMLEVIYEKRITKDYNKLLKYIYNLLESEESTSGDVLIAENELKRIEEYLLALQAKGLSKKLINKYLQKLYILRMQLKKVHVIELEQEIGKGR